MQEPPRKRGRAAKVSRERILEAALTEFAENGYEGATTASVARRVSVTQPLIHYHFGSKEALWRASIELAFSRMQTVLQGVEEDMQLVNEVDAIRVMARRFVYFNSKYPEIGRMIISEAAVRSARLEWLVEQHLRPVFQDVEALFLAAQATGRVKKLPIASVVLAFLGAVPHFFDGAPLINLVWGIDPMSPEHVEGHAETLVEIFSTGLLVASESD
ncbi:MAG: TetR/AcrR family transcriptional regulator [Hyphomicrobiaceae bacterium]